MANYSLVVNSKFQPFSFERYIQPYQMYGQAYNEVENQYAELATKANVWEEMANEQTDPYAYKMYKTFSNDLEEKAGQLAREGLNAASRREMLNMRARYSKEITPIEQAYKSRAEEIKEQTAGRANGIVYEGNASTSSLDRYLNNPSIKYNMANSQEGFKRVSSAASALAKGLRDYGNGKRLDSFTKTWLQEHGYRGEEIASAISDVQKILMGDTNINSNGVLRAILQDEMETSGVINWNNKEAVTDYFNRVAPALYQAVGQTNIGAYEDKAAVLTAQENRARAAKETEDKSRLYYRAVPKTTVDRDKNTRQMNEDLKLIQEVMSNPTLLNKKSTRTVRDPKYISPDPMISFVMDSGLGKSRQETYYPYQEKLAELSKRYNNINYTITDGKLSRGNLAELAQQLDKDIRSSAVRSFSYKPNITQSDLITQVLKENTRSYYRRSNNTGLYELENNKKGDAVDIEDLNSYFTSDSDIDFDPDLGFIINSTDKDGKTRSAVLDTELLDDPNRTFSKAQSSIKAALDNGEDELATLLIEATMKAFYDRYNTLEKRQSNTFSKE